MTPGLYSSVDETWGSGQGARATRDSENPLVELSDLLINDLESRDAELAVHRRERKPASTKTDVVAPEPNERLRIERPAPMSSPGPRNPKRINTRNLKAKDRTEILRYSRVIIAALQEALDYDPALHHNQPPPDLRIEEPAYLNEIRALVAELKRLNDLLEKNRPLNQQMKREVIQVAKHFNKFFGSYANAMGKVAAGLTGAAVVALLYRIGVGNDLLEGIWKQLSLPK